jgi:hypothetical protein
MNIIFYLLSRKFVLQIFQIKYIWVNEFEECLLPIFDQVSLKIEYIIIVLLVILKQNYHTNHRWINLAVDLHQYLTVSKYYKYCLSSFDWI